MTSLLILPVLLALVGQGASAAPDEAAFAAGAPARLAFMKKSVVDYDIRPTGGSTTPFKLLPEPVLRFTNPVGRSRDGTVFLWVDAEGRPAAVAQASLNRRGKWVHEFSSLSPGPLVAKSPRGIAWNPSHGGVEFQPVPGAPRPAESPEKRLQQMRALTRDFAVEDKFQDMTWQPLRLLPKPFARWGEGPTDGALFAFVLTTDPEAYLILETRPGPEGPAWMYAWAPSTTYPLKAKWKDKDVWSRNVEGPQMAPNDTLHQFIIEEF